MDTEDLPLNVSREVTQASPVMAKINTVLTSKNLDYLDKMAKDEVDSIMNSIKIRKLFKSGINMTLRTERRLLN